jgi:vacuolar protein sorting-associated protein 13A/C
MKRNKRCGDSLPLFRVIFNTLGMNLVKKFGESYMMSVVLGRLRVWDGTTENSLYPLIVREKGDLDDGFNTSNDQENLNVLDEQSQDHVPFFNFMYHHAPPEDISSADNKLEVQCRPLEIIYNPGIYKTLTRFFKPTVSTNEPFAALKVALSTPLTDIIIFCRLWPKVHSHQ